MTPQDLIDKAMDDESSFKQNRKLYAARAQVDDLRKSLNAAVRANNKLERELQALSRLKEIADRPQSILVPRSKTGQSVPLFTWSDWHVDERIDPRKIMRKNAYDPEVAERRARKCIESTVKLIRHIRKSANVDAISLCLGGDWISGDIHEELKETNTMAAIEALLFARRLLAEGLETIHQERYIKRIQVSCVVGNHGRTTKKMQFKNGAEKNYETLIYALLAEQFDGPRWDWSVCMGGINYTRIAPQFTVRDFHGHQVKYGGGVGGVSVPLNKWLYRQDQTQKAQFNRMCHYHTFSTPSPNVLLNGSLKGWDEYAQEHGFPFEAPLQACAIYDATRNRIGGVFPVYCE